MITQSACDEIVRSCEGCIVDHAILLEQTESTQDAALEHFDGSRPVIVVADQQTKGRGQRGNRWDDGDGGTLACTIALPASGVVGHDPCRLSAIAGLAAMHAIAERIPVISCLQIKWPNDVLVDHEGVPKKIAGVLIEIRDGVVLIGIGINAARRQWCPELGAHATSIEETGGDPDRASLLRALLGQCTIWMGATDRDIRASWSTHDAMRETTRSFLVGNETITGRVLSVDPLSSIRVRTESGERSLAVQTTRNMVGVV